MNPEKMQPLSQGRIQAVQLTFLWSIAEVVGKLLSFPSSLITAKLLAPTLLGQLAIINLIIQYAGYSHFGLLQALYRDLPMAYGRGNKEEARTFLDSILTGYTVLCLLALIVLWFLFSCGVRFNNTLTLPLMVLLSFVFIGNRINSFVRVYVAAEGKLIIKGKGDLFRRIYQPILNLAGVCLFRLEGLLAAMALNELIMTAYYLIRSGRVPVRINWRIDRIVRHIRSGFLVLVNNTLDMIFWSIDLVMLASFATKEQVGIYSMALALMNTAVAFTEGVGQVLSRKMLLIAGKHGTADKTIFKRYMEDVLTCFLFIISIIVGLCVIAFTLITNIFLHKFAAASQLAVILSTGYMIYISRTFFVYYFNATGQLHRRLWLVIFGIALNAGLDYLALKNGYGMMGVAVSCCISFIFISFGVLTLAFSQIYESRWKGTFYFARLLLTTAILAGLAAWMQQWNLMNYPDLSSTAGQCFWGAADAVLKGLAYVATSATLFHFLFTEYRVYQNLKPLFVYARDMVINRSWVRSKNIKSPLKAENV